MINNSGAKSNINWWNNPAVIAELEQEYRARESGMVDRLEDSMMDRPHQTGKRQMDYLTPLEYWPREIGVIQ